MSERAGAGLAALEARLRHDLACLNHPPANWVPPRLHQGREVTDVVLVGGGMCGLVAAFSLLRLGISNLRLLDRGEEGREGPWITYARMDTLRSPKHLVGPAADLPPLTFRAWYEAQFGRESWERLGKIPGQCGCNTCAGTGKSSILRSITASKWCASSPPAMASCA